MYAIEAMKLTKQFHHHVAVDHVSLQITEGTLFALLGVNGAGKTTLIKMLSGLTKPTSGDALLLGDSIVKQPYAVKQKINVSPQETAIAPNLTTRENLAFLCGLYGCSRKEQEAKVSAMIEAFHLQPIEKQKAKTLSGGWQRRVSIAMALISEPKILFLDEPTLGLDVLARRELWQMIMQLKKKVTIILTTHYLEEAEALSDEVGIMVQGKIMAAGTAHSLMKQTKTNTFEDAFVKICEGGTV